MGLPKPKRIRTDYLEKKRMKNQTDFTNVDKYKGDAVIHRGYAIYDEWLAKKLSSKKIVNRVIGAACSVKQNTTNAASIEALSCLFALDLRIAERYKSILHCIFRCFSWRREANALNRLKGILHISKGEDIRSAIETRLQRLREDPADEIADDGDDEARGGKRNGKSAEEETLTEEKRREQVFEEKAARIVEAEEPIEATEEMTEDASEQAPADEQIEEQIEAHGERLQSAETSQEAIHKEKEPMKEEHNGPAEQAEPRTDKQPEVNVYHDAIDFPPIYEVSKDTQPTADNKSLLDDGIIEHTVKGGGTIFDRKLSEYLKADREIPVGENAVAQEAETGRRRDRDGHLFDKTVIGDKGEASQRDEKSGESKQSEKENLRIPILEDLSNKSENHLIKENNNISKESTGTHYHWQVGMMREPLRITDAEIGMDTPGEIIDTPGEIIERPNSLQTPTPEV
jgi:hypothetical protein